MTTRIDKKLVTFKYPFLLEDIETELPAGGYTIETEEESICGSRFQAFRHIETILVVRPSQGKQVTTQYWPIDPKGLALALADDAARALTDLSDGKAIISSPNT